MIIILKIWINRQTKVFCHKKASITNLFFLLYFFFISHFCHTNPKVNYKTVYYSTRQHMSDLLTLFLRLVTHMLFNCIFNCIFKTEFKCHFCEVFTNFSRFNSLIYPFFFLLRVCWFFDYNYCDVEFQSILHICVLCKILDILRTKISMFVTPVAQKNIFKGI